jgi:hypothetical protein
MPVFGDEPESRRRFKVKMPIFDDEPESRRHFPVKNALFWRRESISSPFLGEKLYFLATRLNLVTTLRRKMLIFDDEPESRHRFKVKNACF